MMLGLTWITTLFILPAAIIVFVFARRKWQCLPPGPIALPIVGHLHLLGPLIHQSFHELSKHYGPLFYLRLGHVKCVVASTPELAREFLKVHDLTFSSRKNTIATKRLTYGAAFAFAPYGSYWKFINKLNMTKLLSPRALNQFFSVRNDELNNFIRGLAKMSADGKSVNVTMELLRLTNNVISQMMLSMSSLDKKDGRDEVRKLVREVTQLFGEFNVSDFIWVCKNLDLQGFHPRIEDIHRRYDSLREDIITKREEIRKDERPCDARDFLDILLDAAEDRHAEIKISREHIKALVLDFLTAATDTTAISVEWSLAELFNNPRVLKKAQEEIDNIVGQDRLVQELDIQNLPYIQAIVKETFRLHPPIPMIIRKSVSDCKINGYHIAKDTLLFLNTWAIGRDADTWESPLDYRPERFLQLDIGRSRADPLDVKGQHFELLPFGTGRRGCPGMNLALLEVPTILAAMIQCFDWKLANGSDVAKRNAGDDQYELLDMSEQPGLTIPRAKELRGIPIARVNLSKFFPSM